MNKYEEDIKTIMDKLNGFFCGALIKTPTEDDVQACRDYLGKSHGKGAYKFYEGEHCEDCVCEYQDGRGELCFSRGYEFPEHAIQLAILRKNIG